MDIVERLRTEAPSYVLIGDAAVEIERLREALQPFADVAEYGDKHCPDMNDSDEISMSVADLRRAYTALKESE
jgi:hypothetical protein